MNPVEVTNFNKIVSERVFDHISSWQEYSNYHQISFEKIQYSQSAFITVLDSTYEKTIINGSKTKYTMIINMQNNPIKDTVFYADNGEPEFVNSESVARIKRMIKQCGKGEKVSIIKYEGSNDCYPVIVKKFN
jgi:hypothetical protein